MHELELPNDMHELELKWSLYDSSRFAFIKSQVKTYFLKSILIFWIVHLPVFEYLCVYFLVLRELFMKELHEIHTVSLL